MAYKIKTANKKDKEKKYYEGISVRVTNAENFVGSNLYPARYDLGLKEGKDYQVLAYSDYADTFVPTIVKWKTGEVDNFSDEQRTRKIISNLHKYHGI